MVMPCPNGVWPSGTSRLQPWPRMLLKPVDLKGGWPVPPQGVLPLGRYSRGHEWRTFVRQLVGPPLGYLEGLQGECWLLDIPCCPASTPVRCEIPAVLSHGFRVNGCVVCFGPYSVHTSRPGIGRCFALQHIVA